MAAKSSLAMVRERPSLLSSKGRFHDSLGDGLRVAVADDDPAILEFVRDLLEGMGYTVTASCSTGQELIDACHESAGSHRHRREDAGRGRNRGGDDDQPLPRPSFW